jgi:integrase
MCGAMPISAMPVALDLRKSWMRQGGMLTASGPRPAALACPCAAVSISSRVAANPCTGVWRPGPPPARERVLTPAELRAFWAATDRVGEPFGAALKLLLLTGARRDEVAGMRKQELSEDGATWTLPGERTKNHRAHVVPLPPLAQRILADVPHIEGPFVFTTTGKKPISGFSRMKARLDGLMLAAAQEQAKAAGRVPDAVSIPPWRVHDLRRSAATGMAELGIAPHIVEACLNHVSGARAGVAGVYNRATYAAEKETALMRWAAHVEALVSGQPSNVVSLPVRERV